LAKIERLIGFGCSHTYGQALPDTVDPKFPGQYCILGPSKHSWVGRLAKMLNVPFVNQGKPGGSNKEIWRRAMLQEYNPSDLVVIQWTINQRHMQILDDKMHQVKHVNVWDSDSKEYYTKWYNPFDAHYDSLRFADHITYHINSKGATVMHYNWEIKTEVLRGKYSYWNFNYNGRAFGHSFQRHLKKNPEQPEGHIFADLAADDSHPGIRTQAEFASQIYADIKGPAVTGSSPN
jgi:hypothetical protein